jgi:hypothetical protein
VTEAGTETEAGTRATEEKNGRGRGRGEEEKARLKAVAQNENASKSWGECRGMVRGRCYDAVYCEGERGKDEAAGKCAGERRREVKWGLRLCGGGSGWLVFKNVFSLPPALPPSSLQDFAG